MRKIGQIGSSVCMGRFQAISAADKRATDDEDIFDGAPVGIQVMGQRLQEEKVLAMMEAVHSALQQHQHP